MPYFHSVVWDGNTSFIPVFFSNVDNPFGKSCQHSSYTIFVLFRRMSCYRCQCWFAWLFAEINESAVGIDMTSLCQYPVPVGLEKDYIPDENLWTTSQINALRGAQYARLHGWRGLYFPFWSYSLSVLRCCWLDARNSVWLLKIPYCTAYLGDLRLTLYHITELSSEICILNSCLRVCHM